MINRTSEKYRSTFVNHNDKKNIHVNVSYDTQKEDIIKYITEKTIKECKVDLMGSCGFSTSNSFYETMANFCVLNTLKSYFTYSFSISCGLRNVSFIGTIDDWKLLKTKITNLQSIHVKSQIDSIDSNLAKFNERIEKEKPRKEYSDRYLENQRNEIRNRKNNIEGIKCGWLSKVEKTIDTFIATLTSNDINVNFWNSMIFKRHATDGYTQMKYTYFDGWIFDFCATENGIDLFRTENKPNELINIEFEVDVKNENITYTFQGGFSNVCYADGLYRPQMEYRMK